MSIIEEKMRKLLYAIVFIALMMCNLSIAGNQQTEDLIKVTTLIENRSIAVRIPKNSINKLLTLK